MSPEMRRFIEEAKASGVTRCPIRDIEAQMDKCPVDFAKVTPAEAKKAVEQLIAAGDGRGGRAGDDEQAVVTGVAPSALVAGERAGGRGLPAPRRGVEPHEALQPELHATATSRPGPSRRPRRSSRPPSAAAWSTSSSR